MDDQIEDGIEMGRAYRWWVFGVLRDWLRADALRAMTAFAASLRPGPWGEWNVFCSEVA